MRWPCTKVPSVRSEVRSVEPICTQEPSRLPAYVIANHTTPVQAKAIADDEHIARSNND